MTPSASMKKPTGSFDDEAVADALVPQIIEGLAAT
jgi:hypothetical protein